MVSGGGEYDQKRNPNLNSKEIERSMEKRVIGPGKA